MTARLICDRPYYVFYHVYKSIQFLYFCIFVIINVLCIDLYNHHQHYPFFKIYSSINISFCGNHVMYALRIVLIMRPTLCVSSRRKCQVQENSTLIKVHLELFGVRGRN